MAMQKTYSRINWQNYPSEETALSASNLNRTDYAINEIDDRVINLDTQKLDASDALTLVRSVQLNNQTGVLTVTYKNGVSTTYQTVLNQVAVNFTYNATYQRLEITESDGTVKYVSLSDFITQYEFVATSTIAPTVDADGKVSFNVLDGSIGDEKLRTDYLADIRVSEANAAQSESDAEAHQFQSEAWAVGQRDGTDVETTDECYQNNSKYYAEVAGTLKSDMETIKTEADTVLEQATARLTGLNFMMNYVDGNLYYDINVGINLQINNTTGELMWEVIN